MCYMIQEEPSSLLQQMHMQARLLHTVTTRQTAMCWDGVFPHSSKSIIGRAFDHSHRISSSLPHLSLRFRNIMVSAVRQMLHQDLAPSGVSTYVTLINLSLLFIQEDFYTLLVIYSLFNLEWLWAAFPYFVFFSNNQSRRTLKHLPYFV